MPVNTESSNHWILENKLLFLFLGILAAVIFSIDLTMELGVAWGVPYVCLVLVALWSKRKRLIWIAAVLGTLLTLFGYWFSPLGGEDWKVVINRFLALFAIWATAILGHYFKKN
ncbi:hypothetical protein JYT60_02055, partial [bacterium AH-315-C08]|nr:hypothetical protein [bacterium AH-315-C08]